MSETSDDERRGTRTLGELLAAVAGEQRERERLAARGDAAEAALAGLGRRTAALELTLEQLYQALGQHGAGAGGGR
jgi:hypothetical protein